jgi:hypothetical protein
MTSVNDINNSAAAVEAGTNPEEPMVLAVPRHPTREELKRNVTERPVDFNMLSYFKNGWNVSRVNFCKIWGGLLSYFLISILVFGGVFMALYHPMNLREGCKELAQRWKDRHHPAPAPIPNGTNITNATVLPEPALPPASPPVVPVVPTDDAATVLPIDNVTISVINGTVFANATDEAVEKELRHKWWHHDEDDEDDEDDRMWKSLSHAELKVIYVVLGLIVFEYLLLWVPFYSSMVKGGFNAVRTNSKLRFKDFFSSFELTYYPRLLWLTIVSTLATVASIFATPVGHAAFRLFSMFWFHIHRDNEEVVGVWHSLVFSFRAVFRNFCKLLGFVLLVLIINFLGFVAFGFGLLISMPVSFYAFIFMYHDVVGINGVPLYVPSDAEGVSQIDNAPTISQVDVAPISQYAPGSNIQYLPPVVPDLEQSSGSSYVAPYQGASVNGGAC